MKKFTRKVLKDPVGPELDEDLEDDEEYEEEDEDEDEEEEYEDEEEDEHEDEDDEDEDDEDEEDDDGEEEEEDEDEYLPRAKFSRRRIVRLDDDDEEEELSEEMAEAIRAGKYKPKRSDPWSAHTLYNVLKDLGEI